MQVRNGIGDGLFTAHNFEENWALAHRILMPAFGPLPIRDMFDGIPPWGFNDYIPANFARNARYCIPITIKMGKIWPRLPNFSNGRLYAVNT